MLALAIKYQWDNPKNSLFDDENEKSLLISTRLADSRNRMCLAKPSNVYRALESH